MRISSNSIARDMNDGSGSLGDQTPISTMGGGARTSKDLRASGSRGSAKGITPSSKQSAKASMKKALLLSKLATSAGSKMASNIPEGGKKRANGKALRKSKTSQDLPESTSKGSAVEIATSEAMHKMSTLDIEKWETWASGLEKSLQSGHTPPTAPIETLGLLGLEPRLRIAIQRGIAALEYLPSVMQKEKHLLLERRIRELEDGVRSTIVPLQEEYQRLHKLFIQSEQTRGQATLHMRDFHTLLFDYVSERLLTSDDFREIPELSSGRRPLNIRQKSSLSGQMSPAPPGVYARGKSAERVTEDSSEDLTSKWEEWNRLSSEMAALRF
eukprot:GEMP01050036.1.p1 GENE.GEMP01050036.1~~GEMP01050036.1.p1  ORF type:complete len:328 (+),score=54.95 GEMP01050036.1:226-1209(+)